MKKVLLSFVLSNFLLISLFAHNYVPVDLKDPVYSILEYAKSAGLCSNLIGLKPYPQKIVREAIEEIINSDLDLSDEALEILEIYKNKYNEDEKKNNLLHLKLDNDKENDSIPCDFTFDLGLNVSASGGVYSNGDFNQYGFDFIPTLNFAGGIGDKFSYKLMGFIDITKMPLYYCGEYLIGYEWYSEDYAQYLQDNTYEISTARYIKKFINTSYTPYGYKKRWDGQMYLLSNMSADGLESWPQTLGLGFGIDSDIRMSFLNDKIILGGGREYRELAGMDNGSSLVLNANARPFFAVDVEFNLLKNIKYTSLTGILEYPNQDYMNEKSYTSDKPSRTDDSYLYQNAFSVNMIEVDINKLHLDFGSSCVWPKRFEIGYLFPLSNYVEYQNHIGDCDNLALFGDIKYTIKNFGSIWGSIYVDEINGINNNPIKDTRDMFAIQGGIKYLIPGLNFATVSLRYTKVEPYCYTHHSINYTPWYNHYVSESYTNNGECLGYYLPPNSDELLLDFNWMINKTFTMNASYQFSRHGADFGSQAVPGSSLYSELRNTGRDELKKYFLHDGAYNWMHIVNVGGSINLNNKNNITIFGNLGFVYSYFTKIDNASYTNDGECKNCDFKTKFEKVNDNEYKDMIGGILTLGCQIMF